MIDIQNIRQIRWGCRRGMLELDQVLLNFFTNYYASLSNIMQQQFKQLLQESDADLFDWLFNQKLPVDPDMCNLILCIIETIGGKDGLKP